MKPKPSLDIDDGPPIVDPSDFGRVVPSRARPVHEAPDRLPPNAPDAEKGVVACCLLDPQNCIARCMEYFQVDGQAFYDLRLRTLYDTLVSMYDANEAIDTITVVQRLRDSKKLEEVGGIAYVSSIPDEVPSAANLEHYLDIVGKKHKLRSIIQTCSGAVDTAFERQDDPDSILEEVDTSLGSLTDTSRTQTPIIELVQRAIGSIEADFNRGGAISGLSTGFMDFDKMTGGLHEGDMVVIAARPSQGKTALGMNIADYVSVDLKQPVGVFSLEMTSESLVKRMLSSRARINLKAIRDGFMAERDFPKLTNAAGKIAKSKLYIDDTPGLSVLRLRSKARMMKRRYDIKLLVIDYLQLMHSTSRRVGTREQEVADISSGVKSLAKELNIPIIVLSQLNRDLEKEKRKPRLSDIRESGSVENDADVVCLLYAEKPSDEDESNGYESYVCPTTLMIAKQRAGATGAISLTFFKQYTRFESASKISTEDVPQ